MLTMSHPQPACQLVPILLLGEQGQQSVISLSRAISQKFGGLGGIKSANLHSLGRSLNHTTTGPFYKHNHTRMRLHIQFLHRGRSSRCLLHRRIYKSCCTNPTAHQKYHSATSPGTIFQSRNYSWIISRTVPVESEEANARFIKTPTNASTYIHVGGVKQDLDFVRRKFHFPGGEPE